MTEVVEAFGQTRVSGRDMKGLDEIRAKYGWSILQRGVCK